MIMPNFPEVSYNAFLKVTIKSSLRGKKARNLAIFGYFSEAKNGRAQPKRLKCLQQIWHYYPVLRYISSGSRSTHFIESTTKGSPRGKKHSENLDF